MPDNPPPPPPPPPPSPPPCPPFIGQPDCLPQQPASSPDQDEVGDGFAQVAYWLQIQATWVMNIYEWLQSQQPGQGANPQPSDPVTCTQLTLQVLKVTSGLAAIAQAIAALQPGGSAAPDFTAVVQAIEDVAKAIAAVAPGAPVDLTIIEAELAGDPTLQAFIDQLVADGLVAADIGQLI